MNIYKVGAFLLIGICTFVCLEYFEHLNAFKKDNFIEVKITRKDCRMKGSSQVDFENLSTKGFVEVLDRSCPTLQVGEKITVLKSIYRHKYYWNKKPTGRALYLVPFIFGLGIYLLYLDRK